jgi:23S rRNA G2069 N7-methylase RlmK/C1962 C5-methylase RlmI
MRHQLINGGRKFDVILMDPPWKITTKNAQGRAATIQYPTLAD